MAAIPCRALTSATSTRWRSCGDDQRHADHMSIRLTNNIHDTFMFSRISVLASLLYWDRDSVERQGERQVERQGEGEVERQGERGEDMQEVAREGIKPGPPWSSEVGRGEGRLEGMRSGDQEVRGQAGGGPTLTLQTVCPCSLTCSQLPMTCSI